MVKFKVRFKSWLTMQASWAMIGLYELGPGREVMDLDCFVYDFVIFSLIDDYDGVFGDLEWVEGEFKLAIN